MAKKYVYFFGAGSAEGNKGMKDLLGGKGANLAEMAGLGLPVPPGFTISTEVCTLFYKSRKRIPDEVRKEVEKNLARLEKALGQKLGDAADPLLVSIRSGARASMPGMMDTILNLGLNEKTAAALVAKTGNPRFVYDSYRRFVQMYGDVVLGLKPVEKDDIDPFEAIIEAKKRERKVHQDTDLTAKDLKDLVARFKAAIKEKTGHDFPEDPMKQLWGAIGAVFGSWSNDRAIAYRKMYDIPESWGTAVNVQTMVFGNMGQDSGTGVAFTRDAATRRERLLRRVPDERPGRGRRGRHPDAAPHLRAPEGRSQVPRPAREDPPHPREALHGHDGHRVHHPAGQALYAPVPRRQAHRLRRDQDRRGHGRREAHQREGSPLPHRARPAQPASAADLRPRREGRRRQERPPPGQGPQRGPRRRHRPHRLQFRGRRGLGEEGRKGHPDPHRDLARGYQGHERRARAS